MNVQNVRYGLRRTGQWAGIPSRILTLGTETDRSSSPDELLHELDLLDAPPTTRTLIIDGYEPLTQQLELLRFLFLYHQARQYERVLLETTGGIMPDVRLREFVAAWDVHIHPQNRPARWWSPEPILFFRTQNTAVFEYVVHDQRELTQALQYIQTTQCPLNNVLLTPVITSNKPGRALAEKCDGAAEGFGLRSGRPIWAALKGTKEP